MKNRFIKANPKDIEHSSFAGYLQASYKDLVACFGEPNDRTKDGPWQSYDWKVRAEWTWKSTARRDRAVITIYDYKETQPVDEVTLWHVGLKGSAKRLREFMTKNRANLIRLPKSLVNLG
ncbi:hypothetical protein KGQ27_02540 [Patescibacteria group bacterium]|nr:hypothetical protein [Patescibacteria group bacterium]MDE1946445.1 hypothetical protein [Patescibacteria group bacterium]MDE2011053.1 hypothetical protein [Patescibacteria group bacterium]MDE2233532.1 hypothetical protein [Patescibacteria group bacterium]